MTSHYRNTISIAYLLLSLFTTSSSARSFIRQYTDGFNPNLQQEKGAAGSIQHLEEEEKHYLHKRQEISSRDYKTSVSSPMKGLRDGPPSTYSLQMDSFNAVLNSNYGIYEPRYESRPFSVGGYNWTLVVYPHGNKNDNGTGYLSLYVVIDNSTLTDTHEDVYADLRFYIYNKNERKYFTIQDTDGWRFNAFQKMWGFSQVLPVDTFKDPKNGYLYEGDHCEFGVDVTIPTPFETSELFSITNFLRKPKFTWAIQSFSKLDDKEYYNSDSFSIGGRSWYLQVYPNGYAGGKYFSTYLFLNKGQKRPYESVYIQAKLRVLNQRGFDNAEETFGADWYIGANPSSEGVYRLISLDDLNDQSKGFIVNDTVMVQVEIEAISSIQYNP